VYLIQAHRIVDVVNQPAVRASCDNLIGLQPERQLLHVEYLLDFADKLHRELFLPHIIVALHNESEEPPRLQVAKRACQANSILLLLGGLLDKLILLPPATLSMMAQWGALIHVLRHLAERQIEISFEFLILTTCSALTVLGKVLITRAQVYRIIFLYKWLPCTFVSLVFKLFFLICKREMR